MTRFLFLVLMVWSVGAWGQVEFAPVGAKWTLTKFTPFNSKIVELKVIEETLLEEITVKKIDLDENPQDTSSFIEHFYSYQNGDSVYFYTADSPDFMLVYNFSLLIGDTLDITTPFGVKMSYRIDSLGTIVINNHNLRVQYVTAKCSFDDDYTYPKFRIIEGLGALPLEGGNDIGFFFFENLCLLDSHKYVFRCYEDETIGEYKTIEGDCFVSTSTKEFDLEKEKIFIAPNPSSEQVTLTFSEPLFTKEIKVEVFSLEGISVLNVIKSIGKEVLDFNIAHLTAGIYFIKIQDQQGFIQTLKMVKQ